MASMLLKRSPPEIGQKGRFVGRFFEGVSMGLAGLFYGWSIHFLDGFGRFSMIAFLFKRP